MFLLKRTEDLPIFGKDGVELSCQYLLKARFVKEHVADSLRTEVLGDPWCVPVSVGKVLEPVKDGVRPALPLAVVATWFPQEKHPGRMR